jgi:hypothetical protein
MYPYQEEQLNQILDDAQVPEANRQACFNNIAALFNPVLETPEQFETRTGEAYPTDGAVYVKWYDPATGYPNPGGWWDAGQYGSLKTDRNVFALIVANCDNIPAADWVPPLLVE